MCDFLPKFPSFQSYLVMDKKEELVSWNRTNFRIIDLKNYINPMVFDEKVNSNLELKKNETEIFQKITDLSHLNKKYLKKWWCLNTNKILKNHEKTVRRLSRIPADAIFIFHHPGKNRHFTENSLSEKIFKKGLWVMPVLFSNLQIASNKDIVISLSATWSSIIQ